MSLANNIGGKVLPPLSAVRRKKKGPNGEPKGSIATAQTEVDEIVREAYAEVYKGNLEDIEESTQRYMQDYSQYIYEGKETNITPLSGADLKDLATNA